MSQCPNCNERMWSANKGSLMVCLNPDCMIEDDRSSVENSKSKTRFEEKRSNSSDKCWVGGEWKPVDYDFF